MSTYFVAVTQIFHQLNFTIIIPDEYGFSTIEKTIYLDQYDPKVENVTTCFTGDDGGVENIFDFNKFIQEKINLQKCKDISSLYRNNQLPQDLGVSLYNDSYENYTN